jgi:hypothetical protein
MWQMVQAGTAMPTNSASSQRMRLPHAEDMVASAVVLVASSAVLHCAIEASCVRMHAAWLQHCGDHEAGSMCCACAALHV